jgi:hypothetical protein
VIACFKFIYRIEIFVDGVCMFLVMFVCLSMNKTQGERESDLHRSNLQKKMASFDSTSESFRKLFFSEQKVLFASISSTWVSHFRLLLKVNSNDKATIERVITRAT